MVRTHAEGDWPTDPLCGDTTPDSAGTVTTHPDADRADCPACVSMLGAEALAG